MTRYIAIKSPQTREELKEYSKKYKLHMHNDTIDWWFDYCSYSHEYLVLQLSEKGRQIGCGYCEHEVGDIPVLTLNTTRRRLI